MLWVWMLAAKDSSRRLGFRPKEGLNTWRGWCRRTAVAYLMFSGWASLSPRGILFQQETSLSESQMSLFAQYWPVLEPEEAVAVSDTMLEPRQQQYRAASEPAVHRASSNSQSFSSGFDLSKHNGSIYGFRLLWICMVCGDKPKVDLALLGREFIAQTELSIENLHSSTKPALLPCQGSGC